MIEPIWQPEIQQAAFRQLVKAFSGPGQIVNLPMCNCDAALAALAALVDGESSLADPHKQLDRMDWLRLQLKTFNPELAAFIVCQGRKPVDFEPNIGTLESPEQGATLVLRVDALSGGEKLYRLTGPGIKTVQDIAPQGLNATWFDHRLSWNNAFPLGVDMVLTSKHSVLSLPRTTHIKELS